MELIVEIENLDYLQEQYPDTPLYIISTIANSGTFWATYHGVEIEIK